MATNSRSYPAVGAEQVIILDAPPGGIRLAVHRTDACCAVTLCPTDALAVAADLRFRAFSLMLMKERS